MSQLYTEGRKYLNVKNYEKALEVFAAGDKAGAHAGITRQQSIYFFLI